MFFKHFDSPPPLRPCRSCQFSYSLKDNRAVMPQQGSFCRDIQRLHRKLIEVKDERPLLIKGISKWSCGKGHICIALSISSVHLIRQQLRLEPDYRGFCFSPHNFAHVATVEIPSGMILDT